jgi:hypothetical protein
MKGLVDVMHFGLCLAQWQLLQAGLGARSGLRYTTGDGLEWATQSRSQ